VTKEMLVFKEIKVMKVHKEFKDHLKRGFKDSKE